MVTEFFPYGTFHMLSLSDQRSYMQDGIVNIQRDGYNFGGHRERWERKETRRDKGIAREQVILQAKKKRNRIVPRRSVDFKELLRSIQIVDEVTDDEGTLTTILTEHVGVVDIETLSTRYVLHFDSMHRDQIEALLRNYLIDKYRCTDGHTIVIPRLIKHNF